MDIKDFINNRNDVYKNEIYPFLAEKDTVTKKDVDTSGNIFGAIGACIGIESANSLNNANHIVLKHLEAYHQWLTEHYELVPKK